MLLWISSIFMVSLLVVAKPLKAIELCQMHKNELNGYRSHRHLSQQTGIDPALVLSIIQQESGFRSQVMADKQPVWKRWLWGPKSTAYGYAQATDASWKDYKRAMKNDHLDRSDYLDSVGFVYWTLSRIKKRSQGNINDYDAYIRYYHGINISDNKISPQAKYLANIVARQARAFKVVWGHCQSQLSWLSDWQTL